MFILDLKVYLCYNFSGFNYSAFDQHIYRSIARKYFLAFLISRQRLGKNTICQRRKASEHRGY